MFHVIKRFNSFFFFKESNSDVVTRDIKQAQVYSIYSLCDTCNTVRGIV